MHNKCLYMNSTPLLWHKLCASIPQTFLLSLVLGFGLISVLILTDKGRCRALVQRYASLSLPDLCHEPE